MYGHCKNVYVINEVWEINGGEVNSFINSGLWKVSGTDSLHKSKNVCNADLSVEQHGILVKWTTNIW